MAANDTRYLLGYGERLTEPVTIPSGGGDKALPYTVEEAVQRLLPMLEATTSAFAQLPDGACPADEVVGTLTLHPQWIAKSYHPQSLLNEYGLRQVGSRPTLVTPEQWTKKADPEPTPTTDLYVAGPRTEFERWGTDLAAQPSRVNAQFLRLEAVRAPTPAERLRVHSEDRQGGALILEVVLHASASDDYIVSAFAEYAHALDADVDLDRRLYVRGLCFLPVEVQPENLDALSRFTFLRVARDLPRLRSIAPFERAVRLANGSPCPLPDQDAADIDLRAVVFDGGFDPTSPLGRWVASIEPEGIGASVPELQAHGHDVTSALLFGPLTPGQAAPRPYGVVDHVRVLDEKSESDPFELYDALLRIDSVLRSGNYQFINLSVAPALCIEDDEVHSWTAVIDDYLSSGDALATIATGNNGGHPVEGERRVQVPSDAVNAMAVGAADTRRSDWARAEYSAIGPGRTPGLVKPDIVAFGGDAAEPYVVYDETDSPNVSITAGTSFASPSALRLAMGVRAHFGGRFTPLGIKALMIHGAEPGPERSETGWGRVPSTFDDLVVCGDGTVRVIYQGELTPAKYLRAQIPLPTSALAGLVTVAATFCYTTATDPEDPGNYTRAGLDIIFRPNSTKFTGTKTEADTASFFRRGNYDSENELRRDAQKWETTLSDERRFRGTTLHNPVFDIHYNAREAGAPASTAEAIKYALVLTVTAPKVPDLYDQVLRTFAGRLEAFRPVIDIPVRV